jgi:hypothetical protein
MTRNSRSPRSPRPTTSRRAASIAIAIVAITAFGLPTAGAAPPSEAVADQFAGQILFLDAAPPAKSATADWYIAHRITQRAANADKKWALHLMVFLRVPLDKPRLDIAVTKATSANEPVQKLVFYPTGDGRAHYFATSLAEPLYAASTRYRFRVMSDANVLSEGALELLPPSAAAAVAFDADAAQDALMKVLYQDCKAPDSAGGDAKLLVTFAAKDGRVAKVDFAPKPPVPYSASTQACIVKRFRAVRVRVRDASGPDRVVPFVITL